MMGNRVTNQTAMKEETPVVVVEETPVMVIEETPVVVVEETPVVIVEETPVMVIEEKLLEVFPDPVPEESAVQTVKVDTADDAIEYLIKNPTWNEFRERRDQEHKKAQALMRSFMDSLMADPDVFGTSKPVSEPTEEPVSEPVSEPVLEPTEKLTTCAATLCSRREPTELTLEPVSKKPRVVFICDRKIMCYFEDYINTFHNIFDVSIFLFIEPEMINGFLSQQIIADLQKDTFYIFMQFVPPNVMEKLELYASKGFKMGIFNTEQLSKKEHAWMINCQHPFFYRVDYSEVNLLVVANEMNHKKIYLPYQVHPSEIRCADIKKDKGVCIIYPYKSERRYKIIHDLKAKGIQVDEISGFREARDAELFRYKVLINVHFAEDFNIFEEMRCVRAIFNQMIVVSEKSWYDDLHLLRRHFLVCDYDQIVAKVVDVVVNYDLYHNHLFRSFDKLMPVYDADLQAIALENIAKVK